jgi:hypothetical protein
MVLGLLGVWRSSLGFLNIPGNFVDISWIFLVVRIFLKIFGGSWRILEVLEEFCNVERRLEGGDGLAPETFGK